MNINSMAAILAFKDVASIPRLRITMNTANKISIPVHWKENLINFTLSDNSLYLFDTYAPEKHHITDNSKKCY